MKITYPTCDRLRELFNYDPSRGVLIWKVNASFRNDIGKCFGGVHASIDGLMRRRGKVDGTQYYHAPLVWIWHHDRPMLGLEIDHIDNQTDNDRIENLRISNRAQQTQNRRFARKSRLLPKGIRLCPSGKYCARIQHNGRPYHLGMFTDLEQAKRAYNQKAIELFGEFANIHQEI